MTAITVASDRAGEYQRMLVDHGEAVADDSEILLADPGRLGDVDLSGVTWIQSTWAGVDAVDWSRVPESTVVTSLPGVFGPQMVEFVFAHLLAHTQRVVDRHRGRSWDARPPTSVRGSRFGVLGAGSIGSALALFARSLGMETIGCSRSGRPVPGFDIVYPIERLGDFAAGIDHLVVSLPSTDATDGLVDAGVLGRLTTGATIINVGRGSTVDLDAVIDATRSGAVGLAVLDVTEPEPLPDGHAAWDEPNIVVTGHTAAHSRPSDVIEFFVDNLSRRRRGLPLVGVVDREAGY